MNPLRRRFALAGALSLAGCASPSVVAPGGTAMSTALTAHRYTETITSLLISQDRRHIVVIGSGYHYVFDAPPGLLALLASSLHARSRGALSAFQVDPRGRIRGRFSLAIDDLIQPAEQEAARAMGFVRGGDAARPEAFTLQGELVGQRYLQSTLVAARSTEKLNQPYTVEIIVEQSPGDRAAEALGTPITVATDGVLLLYTIALSPLVVPLVVMTREKRN